jgi:glycosyltransferase involved in cell wall biosynthesis
MIVIISQYFYPSHASTSQLMTDLARGLVERNYDVRVYTGTPSSSLKFDKVNITRSPDPLQSSKSILGKLVSSFFFLVGALFYVTFKVNKTYSLLIASNPPYSGIIGIVFKFLKGGKYYFLLQDVFPESAILSGIIKPESKLISILNRLIYFICKNSEKTIILSDSMKKLMESKYPDLQNLCIIENWSIENIPVATKQNNSFASEYGLDKKFTILYSGNIGRLHDIETIAESIKILNATQPDIQFVFIGDGAKLKLLKDYQRKFTLNNLLLLPFQPRELLSQTLTTCDVALVSIIKGAECIVAPCKLYGMLASGRAIVSISEQGSYIDNLLTAGDCGINCSPGNSEQLADIFHKLAKAPEQVKTMGTNSHKLYLEKYTLNRALEEYEAILRHD